MPWGTDLWDRQDKIEACVDERIEQANQLRNFLTQLQQVEVEYAQKLKKVVQPFNAMFASVNTTCNHAWSGVLAAVDSIGSQHQSYASSLTDILQTLKQVAKDRMAEKATYMADLAKLHAAMNATMQKLDKERKKYDKLEKEAEAARIQFEKADKSDNVTRAKVEKCRSDWAKKAKTMEEAQRGLQQELDSVNAFRMTYYQKDLPALFNRFQSLSENTAADFISSCQNYAKCYKIVIPDIATALSAIEELVSQHNRGADSDLYASLHKSGQPLPGDLTISTSGERGPDTGNVSSSSLNRPPLDQPVYNGSDNEDDEPAPTTAPNAAPPPPPPTAAPTQYIKCRAVYDFAGTNEGELPLSAGDVVLLLENDGSGWVLVAKSADGPRGYAPESYLQVES